MTECYFTSKMAHNGCAGFRPGDDRHSKPTHQIWEQYKKPPTWTPKAAAPPDKTRLRGRLNVEDYSPESLAKHKVSVAEVLSTIKPEIAPARPRDDSEPAAPAARPVEVVDAEAILADETAWPALGGGNAPPAPAEEEDEEDWEICSQASVASSSASAWEVVDAWRLVGDLTFKETAATPSTTAAPATRAPKARAAAPARAGGGLKALDEDEELGDEYAVPGENELSYARRTRRTRQSQASRDRRLLQKSKQRA